jgi:hypothetical protein
MSRALVVILGGLLLPFSLAAAAPPADETREPPLRFRVQIGAASVTLAEGEPGALRGQFVDPVVSVTPEPFRVFELAGISFRYPRAFTFEADVEDPSLKSWTLSGNDLRIMCFALLEAVSPEAFARNLTSHFGPGAARVREPRAVLRLGKETLDGVVVDVVVAKHRMTMSVYGIPGPGHRILVLQDSPDESGRPSREAAGAVKELEASFARLR